MSAPPKLTEAQQMFDRIWPGLRKLARDGVLLVPTDLSWRRADKLVKMQYAELYPFHRRWQGRLTITPAGRHAMEQSK